MEAVAEYGALTTTRDAGLRAHFHDETQITIVLSGVRSFMVGGREIVGLPGECIIFPAGVPHRPLPGAAAICLNAYVRTDSSATEAIVASAKTWLNDGRPLSPDEMARAISARVGVSPCVKSTRPLPAHSDRPASVKCLAAKVSMSREAFSRRFAHTHGMAPHAFGVIRQLNAARLLLSAGEDVAGVAALAGFADQSHLGRWFRAAFGTTPARYKRGARP